MKKNFAILFLMLAMQFSVCTAETYSALTAAGNGIEFVSPVDINDQNTNVFTDKEGVVPDPTSLIISAPHINVSEADEEGNAVWTVEYDYSTTITFHYDSSFSGE